MQKQNDEGIKERILAKSIQLFSDRGFHGTSMRDIAEHAQCSLPMLYYYYKNKQVLYEAIACDEFLRMHESLNHKLPFIGSLPEFYKAFLNSRKNLSPDQKSLYKLALKTMYGFEDLPQLTHKLRLWEHEREHFNKQLIAKYYGTSEYVAILSTLFYRMIENITTKLILQDTQISEEEIAREIDIMFATIANNQLI